MSELIEFPTADVLNWVKMERAIRSYLSRHGFSAPACSAICAKAREVHEALPHRSVNVTFEDVPQECAKYLKQFEERVVGALKANTGALFAELIGIWAAEELEHPTPLVNKAAGKVLEPLEEHEVVAVASTHGGGSQ
jgi:hypothetical protein